MYSVAGVAVTAGVVWLQEKLRNDVRGAVDVPKTAVEPSPGVSVPMHMCRSHFVQVIGACILK